MAGEYTGGVVRDGVRQVRRAPTGPTSSPSAAPPRTSRQARLASAAKRGRAATCTPRPPSFCTGCPERPIFAAMKLVERELGPHHVSCDIGCHLFSILPPFNIGNTTMGYGLGGAGAAALNAKARQARDRGHGRRRLLAQRPHLLDRQRRLQQERQRPHHRRQRLFGRDRRAGHPLLRTPTTRSARPRTRSRRRCAASASKWVRTLTHTYDVARMRDTLKEALTTPREGPEGHRRAVGMHAEQAAPRAPAAQQGDQGRQARGARALRRRCRHLHRRPLLHPPLGLPVADDRAQSRSAAQRAGDQGDQLLRRLRAVRRGRACRGALPVLLPRLDHQQSDRLGPLQGARARAP